MIRALASFIMRSRLNAALMAVLGALVPQLNVATVGLVTLRKGFTEGTWIFFAALLAIVAMFGWQSAGAASGVALWFAVASLLLTLVGAQLLRVSRSWPITLMGLVASGCLFTLLMPLVAGSALSDAIQWLETLLMTVAQQQGLTLRTTDISQRFVLGLMAYSLTLTTVLIVVLCRWLQALLYNPGGFRQEIHQLRLPPLMALVCLGGSFATQLMGDALGGGLWPNLFLLPLHMAGLCWLHWVFAFRGWRRIGLIGFYVALLLVPIIAMVALTAIAVMDSFLHLRLRLTAQKSKSDH